MGPQNRVARRTRRELGVKGSLVRIQSSRPRKSQLRGLIRSLGFFHARAHGNAVATVSTPSLEPRGPPVPKLDYHI